MSKFVFTDYRAQLFFENQKYLLRRVVNKVIRKSQKLFFAFLNLSYSSGENPVKFSTYITTILNLKQLKIYFNCHLLVFIDFANSQMY